MDVGTIANSLKARAPWEVAQKILAQLEMPRGMGWDRTLEKLETGEGLPDGADEALVDAVRNHLLSGEKLSRFYPADETDVTALRAAALSLKIDPESTFVKAYPLVIEQAAMAAAKFGSPQLVAVEQFEAGTAIVFASIRTHEIREPLEREGLSDDAAKVLARYEEVVGIRHVRRQAMDVVWIPANDTVIEVRVDFPKEMHQDQGRLAHEHIRESLSLLTGCDFLTSPVNLFPLVDRLYRSAEGTVVELAFSTSTGSLKHEKMRRSNLCLREETYHKGGTQALTVPIAPYKISVQWERKRGEISSSPELSLPGVSRMTHLVDAPLHEAVVRRCLDLDDYNFVREKLVSYIVAESKEAMAAEAE